jgi:hypothetical protein
MSIVDEIVRLNLGNASHAAGSFSAKTLKVIERLLPSSMEATAETGCGKSTILFSNISASHTVFALNDRDLGLNSSVLFYETCPLTKLERVDAVFGPTQRTLPTYNRFRVYDCVLIDGPHGYPFPEIEYYYFYPNIRTGGLLIIDDVHIPTIGRLADFLQEDDMFEMHQLVDTTALFRRTTAPLFDPVGDGWWTQKYNRRRTPPNHSFFLRDAGARLPFVEQVGGHDPRARPEVPQPIADQPQGVLSFLLRALAGRK